MKTLILITVVLSGVAVMYCSQTTTSAALPSNTIHNQSASDAADMSVADFAATTWEFLFGGTDRTPGRELPVMPVDLSHFNNPNDNQLSVTWLGHSSLMINIDGYRVLTDPVVEKRVSMLGPTRFNGEVPLEIHQLPSIDTFVISHDHYDHLNKTSIEGLNAKTKLFLVPLGVGQRIVKWGVPKDKIIELDWWEEFRFDGKLIFAATPAQHFSGRGLFDRNKTLWASWVIQTQNHNLFFSGDSGYFDGFKAIGKKYGPFDMTFIECGAYNTSWSQIHMFPEQTVQAHLDLRGKVLHPIHWGTFNLALHPWYEPMERLAASSHAADVDIATPVPGDTTTYGKRIHVAKWWRQGMVQDTNITSSEQKEGPRASYPSL